MLGKNPSWEDQVDRPMITISPAITAGILLFPPPKLPIRFYERMGVRLHCGTINTAFLLLRPRLWQAEFLAASQRKTLADLGRNGIY